MTNDSSINSSASVLALGAALSADDTHTAAKRPPRRVRRAMASRRPPRVFYTMGPKGGIGKSFVCRALLDLLRTLGVAVRAVQVDRGTSLTAVYPELTTTVHVPSADEMRTNPLAAISAFGPLEAALEACITDGADLVVDVGAAQNARVFLEFIAKTRFDVYLASHKIRPVALVLITAEPSAMAQSADLAEILATVHPTAEIVVAQNMRDGDFSFRPGTQARRIWSERVEPIFADRRRLIIPAMATGAWPYFEGHALTFRQIVEADERDLATRLDESRAIAAALRGDVSEWLDAVWTGLAPLVDETMGGADAR
ncbi:MAG: hypothetical protein HC909_02345 [Blastochloris sp.]|nr:hypothetical protein [Blastochloris sp.]